MIKLIIFDIDGTLLKTAALDVLPGVQDFFTLIWNSPCQPQVKIAIASNQGGVGLRMWMEQDHFGNPRGYPTAAQVEERLQALLTLIGAAPDLPVYVSYRYKNPEGVWSPVDIEKRGDPRWQAAWRKPAPGMLLQAMQDAGVNAQQSIYVGDRPEDEGAARAAGCAFYPAQDFFARDWSCCETLDALRKKV